MDAREHLAKLGYTNIEFELAEIDSVTKELVEKEALALPFGIIEMGPAVENEIDEIAEMLN